MSIEKEIGTLTKLILIKNNRKPNNDLAANWAKQFQAKKKTQPVQSVRIVVLVKLLNNLREIIQSFKF